MSTEHPDPADLAIDERLAASHATLVTDLATTLDLDAGAADALHLDTYSALTTDLATVLDVDAGLTDVIGPVTPPLPHVGLAPSPTAAPSRRLNDQLRSLTHPQRLALRSQPAYSMLRSTLNFAISLVLARTLGHNLARTLDRDRGHAIAIARNLNDALEHARYLALTGALPRNHNLGHALDRTRALTHALTRDETRDRDLNLDDAVALARDLARAHAHVRDLADARDLARDLAGDLARALTLARNLTRDLDWDLDLGRALDWDLELGRYWDLDEDLDWDKQQDIRELLKELETLLAEVGDDFVGADLRAAEHVAPSDLTGVRWSLATRWPPSWENRVRSASVEIEPGIFEIRGDGWKRSLSKAGT